MRWRVLIWLLLSGTLVIWWRFNSKPFPSQTENPDASRNVTTAVAGIGQPLPGDLGTTNLPRPDRFGYRVTNSTRNLEELMRDPRAILLENALLDSRLALTLALPAELRSGGAPGSYIVQARDSLDLLRRVLMDSGTRPVAYIPNNAYLVRLPAALAAELGALPQVSAVIPYEPYYKIKPSLLVPFLSETQGPDTELSVKALLFDDSREETLAQLNRTGLKVLDQTASPFGTVAELRCSWRSLAQIAQLPGVQELEPTRFRMAANDLSRLTLGVASNPVTAASYLGLTGSNITVNVNDSGVDTNHPDLSGRVFWDVSASGVDLDGHGTHVAGVIAGNGTESLTVTNAPGSPMPAMPLQFRGLAPAAHIFSVAVGPHPSPSTTDTYLQQTAAGSPALISNNSWHYGDDTEYDLGAASYDAAVRDALPGVPGSQPLLCVFAAGNAGGGLNDGTGGIPDTIQSPGTAKNVITVGALEQARLITNQTWTCSSNGVSGTCLTNEPWLLLTDSSNQVAGFSSRGNVGIGTEGSAGRFKPDVVAPGTFVISTRSSEWDQNAYYSITNNFFGLTPDTNYEEVLSNVNSGPSPFYRFESGTSIAAAEVSGTLALMEEFFQQRLARTNSPALMKALLINGARLLKDGYIFGKAGVTNSQGWGIVQLPNSLPAGLTNNPAAGSPMLLFDQTPGTALADGQQSTRFVSIASSARTLPLRVTLVWTDPAGNPVAGLKLVNDLDLIVTNLQTGEVFLGNDIPPGGDFNVPWQPGTSPGPDIVNNVENVFLQPPLGSNYSITVLGRRIGVNAVTEAPGTVAQDYALVASSGNGEISNALRLTVSSTESNALTFATVVTNSFPYGGRDMGAILLNQRVGANAPLLGANAIALSGFNNGNLTLGTPDQWHFYIFTNGTAFTNAVFLTFQAQSLSAAPGAGDPVTPGQIWTPRADLDLFVSRNPALTNLGPAAIAAADMSIGRGGEQMLIYSNATAGVYYIGVKCESIEGAEYGFVADVSEQPFAQIDSQGNELLRGFPQPVPVPGGGPARPGDGYTFFLTPDSFPARRIIVTNTVAGLSLSDLETTLAHDASSVVLDNHSTHAGSPLQSFVYDDSGEGDLSGVLPTDGPGSLRQFSGQDAQGLWLLTTSTTNQPATNVAAWIFAERQQDLSGTIAPTVPPGLCRSDFVLVPALATNLTAVVTLGSDTGPVSVEVYPVDGSSNCVTLLISGAGATGAITVDQTSHPPLNQGLYVVHTCNVGTNPVDLDLQAGVILSPALPPPVIFSSAPRAPIPDDAVSFWRIMVTNTDRILSAEVGVRLDHPRVSDLVLSLVAPDGTRVLLSDGRGAASTAGLGTTLIVTNSTPVSFSGGSVAVTNTFDAGQTSGTILINYDFFALPDDLRLYYENNLLYDSGLVSFKGSTNISYGPGASTSFTIVMNQGGNSESNTAWFYSVATISPEPLFLTFTENTNLTVTPIKFATPPFTNFSASPGSGLLENGIYYLPEESLGSLIGKPADGQWALEIRDTRAGATNPPPTLLGWQLALELANSIPVPVSLVHSQPSTNLLGPGQIQSYAIETPDWASFATNFLLSASAPVNVLFTSNAPPTGTNAGERVLARGSVAGTWTLRTNAIPGLVPGSQYYLGIQNTNSFTVSVALLVDFDVDSVTTLSAGVPYANTNSGPFLNSDFYRYVVSPDAVRVQFEVNGPTSDVALVARKGPPLPTLGSYDFISANPGTNDQVIVIYDYSRPVSLAGEWFLSVVDLTGSPASYSILATEFQYYGTNIVLLGPTLSDNTLCFSWNSLPGVHYIFQGTATLTDPDWVTLSPTLTASDVTTSFCVSLPTAFQYFRVTEGVALAPDIPVLSSIAYSANGALLQWTDTTNSNFRVQWTPSLVAPNWHSFALPVTSSNGVFLFLDDGSQSGGLDTRRFYRLLQLP